MKRRGGIPADTPAGLMPRPPRERRPRLCQALVEAERGLTKALKRYHPDRGGSQRDVVDVLAYKAEVASGSAGSA
jgi:hypothetical protein